MKHDDIPCGWQKIALGNVCSVSAGGTPSTRRPEYWGGNIKWMASGEIHMKRIYDVERRITKAGFENSNATVFPKQTVLVALAGQGKTRGTVAITDVELTTNQSLAGIILDGSVADPYYVYFNLDRRYTELRHISSGGGRGGLNLEILKGIILLLPPISEQKKISKILLTCDEAIDCYKKIIAAKQKEQMSFRQVYITGIKRLPGFKGKWQNTKLESILTEHRETSSGKEEVCSVSVSKGVVNQLEHLGRVYAAADTTNYNLVKPGDIVYTKSPTGDFPFGIVKRSLLPNNVIVSPLYGVFTPVSPALGVILDFYFESPVSLNNYLKPIIQKGAKNTINITNQTFISQSLFLPCGGREKLDRFLG